MNRIKVEAYVDCPPSQAHRHLDEFFRENPVLELRAGVPGSGKTLAMERDVTVSVSRIDPGPEDFDRLSIAWRPLRGGPFPSFAGEIAVRADDDYNSFRMVLTGSYEAPFGMAGEAFDLIFGRRVAVASARDLIERLRLSIESSFQALEATKPIGR